MLYQLVLQFQGASLLKLLAPGDLEAQILQILEPGETFDGLDASIHGTNIFLYTENPAYTLQRLRGLFPHAESTIGFTAAYRIVADSAFHILWPDGETVTFRLRPAPAVSPNNAANAIIGD